MAKVVHVDGEVLGISEKEWNLVDTHNNVKKFGELYMEYNSDIIKVDNNAVEIMLFLTQKIPDILAGMLDLNKTERKKLDDASFSDQYEVFRDMARKFLGLSLTPMTDDEEAEVAEDPKKPEGE